MELTSTWTGLGALLRALFTGLLSAIAVLNAHEPFDVSWRVMIYPDRIEVVSTMGTEGVRQLLTRAGLSPEQIAESLKARGPDVPTKHPTTVAPLFVQLKNGDTPLKAKSVKTVSEGTEVILTLGFPRPAAGNLEVRVTGYETVRGLRDGVLIVEDEAAGQLDAALLSPENTTLAVSLPEAPRSQ